MTDQYVYNSEELEDMAINISKDDNEIEKLLKKAKQKLDESKLVEDIVNDLKTLIDLIDDWKNGYYNNISKEFITSSIVCLIFLVDPFKFLPDNMLGKAGKMFILAYLVKLVKDEINVYKEFVNSKGGSTRLIEL